MADLLFQFRYEIPDSVRAKIELVSVVVVALSRLPGVRPVRVPLLAVVVPGARVAARITARKPVNKK